MGCFVLSVALFNHFGLSIGSWNLIISTILIFITLLLDKNYIKMGTFLNAVLSSASVDIFLLSKILPEASNSWLDVLFIIIGIGIMGIGGGINSAVELESGPRDGFMLSISSKTGSSIRKSRIIVECFILIIGWLLGGPVFMFTFIFTFIQSPIFQFVYLNVNKILDCLDKKYNSRQLG